MQDESYQNNRERERERERDYTYKLEQSHLEMQKKKKKSILHHQSYFMHWKIHTFTLHDYTLWVREFTLQV